MEQEKIIEEKEKCIEKLTHRKEKANSIANVQGKREVNPVPKHLSKVHDIHRNELLGYRMKADGHAGGDCLSSVSTMHLSYTKNKFERQKINKRVNHHIADFWDHFYCNKISLP